MDEPDSTIQLTEKSTGNYFELAVWKHQHYMRVKLRKYYPDKLVTKDLGHVANSEVHHFIHHMQEAFVYLESL